jgi:hypothetical protein
VVEVQLFSDMFHVFHTFPHLIEAAEATRRIGVFVNREKNEGSDSGVSLSMDISADCLYTGKSVRISIQEGVALEHDFEI